MPIWSHRSIGPWALPAGLVAYVLAMTWGWEFPDWKGVWFLPVFLGSSAAGLMLWWWRRGRPEPIVAAAIVVVVAMSMTAIAAFFTQGMRDIELYLKAGDAWWDGRPVYMQVPLAEAPADLSNYPYLYPPVTLPLFGLLSRLPVPVADALWTALSFAALVVALRLVGLRGRWIALLLLWPPITQGLWVGNVAIPLFLLFAAAPWYAAGLLVPPLFKLYSGLATIWLLRREHWGALVRGLIAVILLLVASLPIVDLRLWGEWIAALEVYRQSQVLLVNLYGFGLGKYVPLVAVLAVGAAVAGLALLTHDRRAQLARLGVATIVASPSLFSHGFLVALPAFVSLGTRWFWVALGITACAPGLAWFGALGLAGAAWFRPELRKRPVADPWHPLGEAAEPWPTAPDVAPRSDRPPERARPDAVPGTTEPRAA